jgi:hypothetical protein
MRLESIESIDNEDDSPKLRRKSTISVVNLPRPLHVHRPERFSMHKMKQKSIMSSNMSLFNDIKFPDVSRYDHLQKHKLASQYVAVFDEAFEEICKIIQSDIWPRFVKSDDYSSMRMDLTFDGSQSAQTIKV